MVYNPGTAITDRQVGRLFGEAYKKAATSGNAINGFSACGIEPFNDDVFDESEFAAAITTERDLPPVDEPATAVRDSEDANDEGATSGRDNSDIDDGNATQINVTADIHFPPPQRSEMPAETQHINQERSVLDDVDAIVEIENDTPSKPVSPWDILPLPNTEAVFEAKIQQEIISDNNRIPNEKCFGTEIAGEEGGRRSQKAEDGRKGTTTKGKTWT